MTTFDDLRMIGAIGVAAQWENVLVEQPTHIVRNAQMLEKLAIRNAPTLKSLEPVGFFPILHEVDVRVAAIGDQCLPQLEKTASLRVLDVRNCKNLSNEAVAAFRRARPDVAVQDGSPQPPPATKQ
jgi:hypothetical protein